MNNEIQHYILLLRRWWWIILLGGVLAGITAFFVSRSQDRVYEATSILLISEGTGGTSNDFSSLQYSERLAQSYVQRLTNYEVLTQAIQNLNVPRDPNNLQRNVRVSLISNSQLISLSVQDINPTIAAALANEIPAVFAERNQALQLERYASSKANLEQELSAVRQELALVESGLAEAQLNNSPSTTVDRLSNQLIQLRDTNTRLLQNLEDVRIAEAGSLNNLIIDDPARVPTNPIRPRVLNNTVLATVVGIMLALGIIFLLDYMDDTVKHPDAVRELTGVDVLAMVADTPQEEALVMLNAPRSPTAEAYRQLRTSLQYISVSHQVKTILVTSSGMGEGKSTTAANLAISLVHAGHRTLLVDCDMRRPNVHYLLGLSNQYGLTDMLLHPDINEEYIQNTEVNGLHVLTTGPLPPNPAELLASEKMVQILKHLVGLVDYVVVDSPPILAVTDGILLSQLVDTTLLVVEADKTKMQALAQTAAQLTAVESHLAGVLLNKVDTKRNGYYYHYSNYNYGETPPRSKSTNNLKQRLSSQLTFSLFK